MDSFFNFLDCFYLTEFFWEQMHFWKGDQKERKGKKIIHPLFKNSLKSS